MNKAQLEALLAKGEITQEEYEAKLQELADTGASEVVPNEQIQDMIRKAVQSESERVRTEYTKKLQDKEQELEALKAAKMTDEERKADELQKAQTELERVQEELKKAEQERLVTAELTKQELPLDAAQFIHAASNEEVTAKVEDLKKLMEDHAKTAVATEFAKHGYTPNGSAGSVSGVNPWSKESFNLTKQAQVLKENPALAKQLKVQAKK